MAKTKTQTETMARLISHFYHLRLHIEGNPHMEAAAQTSTRIWATFNNKRVLRQVKAKTLMALEGYSIRYLGARSIVTQALTITASSAREWQV